MVVNNPSGRLLRKMNKARLLLPVIMGFFITRSLFGQAPVVDRFVDSYAKQHDFSGTILIQNNSKISYDRSFGFANRQLKVPNRNDTKYKVASITKAFTSVLILRLYEQGKIDLTKPIKTYLPDYAGEGAGKVTIHQLLNHTSGMANIDRNLTSEETVIKSGMPHYQAPYTTDELLAKFCSEKLVNEPGKVFDYNNADYIILGKIIERIHGKSYEQVLKETILQPLKLNNSGMLYQHNVLDNLADTYFFRHDLKTLVNDLPAYIENWYAAGALYSTANDILRFSNALFGLKLIQRATLALMIKSGLDDYGYGVWRYEFRFNNRTHTVIKRPGRIMGAQAMLFHLFNEDITIIILSNTATTNLDEFAAEIAKRTLK